MSNNRCNDFCCLPPYKGRLPQKSIIARKHDRIFKK